MCDPVTGCPWGQYIKVGPRQVGSSVLTCCEAEIGAQCSGGGGKQPGPSRLQGLLLHLQTPPNLGQGASQRTNQVTTKLVLRGKALNMGALERRRGHFLHHIALGYANCSEEREP